MAMIYYCKYCEKEFNPEFSKVCPICGEASHDFRVSAETSISLDASTRILQKRNGFKRAIKEMISRNKRSKDPRLNQEVHEEMHIDRINDQYDQVVTDRKTGKVIHEHHGKLSNH